MNYFQYNFTVTPPQPGSEILIALIADSGFESFEFTDTGFIGYIPESLHSNELLNDLNFDDFSFSFSFNKIEQINWNEAWEKNFEPVIVDEICCISAPFHRLEKNYKYNIVIMPKMSFGTGHHDTTRLVCKNMLAVDFKNKTVLDMGCGTGVLAILANKLGASNITAIDIDDWSVENAIENCESNNCSSIQIKKGNSNLLNDKTTFDIILANINKNVLKADLPVYAKSLNPAGLLFLSGFFKTDADELIKLTGKYQLKLLKQESENDWAVLVFEIQKK